ncbi:MAG: 7-cyano-7-deazaguanine synthase, partial [Candidatus Marinimicrobia bacterium]|nr:7-cyano-7-deazaguanine synthase [Candidatus Neomarinimicrobiota bacterium]
MARPMAVVLLSGGMDSAVTLALAAQDHELALLHSDYGQRTEARELRAFHDIAEYYGVQAERRLVLD